MHTSSLTLSRAHDLAAGLLAVAQLIKAEDSAANAVAAELASIVSDASLILQALEDNGAKIAA